MLFNHFANYANLVSGIITIAISLIILFKDLKASVNFLFFLSLFFWGSSLIFNALTFVYSEPILTAQIVRDVAIITGVISAGLIFLTAFAIYKGEHILKKWHILLVVFIVIIVSSIIGSIFDHVVIDNETGVGIKTTQKPWVMIFIYIIPIAFIILAEIYFILTYRVIDEEIIKKRILFFILGFICIILGVLSFAAGGIYEQNIGYSLGSLEIIPWIIAELFWTAGPILMLIGFFIGKMKKIDESNNSKNLVY